MSTTGKVILFSSLGVLAVTVIQYIRYNKYKNNPVVKSVVEQKGTNPIPTHLFPFNVLIGSISLENYK